MGSGKLVERERHALLGAFVGDNSFLLAFVVDNSLEYFSTEA
jgi:hypothetical protein